MAGRIPEQFIDDLLARIDIVEVIEQRVPLKKSGRDWSARCPFHDERSPSFTVSPAKQFYHCFGCGAHGSAIKFLMDYDRLEFVDAVEELASRAGLKVPYEGGAKRAPQEDATDLYAVLDAAAKFYQRELEKHENARTYFDSRGLDASLLVGREVDGGTLNLRVTLPAVVTVDLRIVAPKSVTSMHTPATHTYSDGVRFAALMAIMAAKKKPLVEMKLAELCPDTALKITYTGFELPPARKSGVKVKTVAELVEKLRSEAKVLH